MKKLLFFILLMLSFRTYSQNFIFNRFLFNGSYVKVKGEVNFTDTTMSITTNDILSFNKVLTVSKGDNYQQFKVISDYNTDVNIRITFSKNSYIQKKEETYILSYEVKDNFSNQYNHIVYYLIPK